ncbi:MAG TPA: ThiF family adenylyltransferase [Candidatus Saccharimonadales bacterium]|nr:ThiF family adenylyltransferase [Candidatus Saccharimonadales bacterium]
MMEQLNAHLFPGDGDEHGAVIAASVVSTAYGTRLLASELYLAQDGVDYVNGQSGYKMLTADFVQERVLDCADKKLAYLAIHCHGRDGGRASFSRTDIASHVRGYPALLDILDGFPAGGVVFTEDAAAGDIWLPDGSRTELGRVEITGRPIRRLYSKPSLSYDKPGDRYNRQAMLFGNRGQKILEQQRIAVIGAGGAGSLIVEYLARLGVKDILVIDPDRIEPTNLPRVVGSLKRDTRPVLTHNKLPLWFRRRAESLRVFKVAIAQRLARQADPTITFEPIPFDVLCPEVAQRLIDRDYIFLAADTMQVRLLFNALVHQYLVPGVQVGAKAQLNSRNGEIIDLFSVVRPIVPGDGCLWCNGLILPAKLQEEAISSEEREKQRYVDDEDVEAPSVITLNAVAAADAVNDYLMMVTGLLANENHVRWSRYDPRQRTVVKEKPRQDYDCPECSSPKGRLGKGPQRQLPTR